MSYDVEHNGEDETQEPDSASHDGSEEQETIGVPAICNRAESSDVAMGRGAEEGETGSPSTWRYQSVALVYFVETMDGRIKIGSSQHLADRIEALRYSLNSRIRLLACLPAGFTTESWLCSKFAHYGVGPETFEAAPEILALAASIGVPTDFPHRWKRYIGFGKNVTQIKAGLAELCEWTEALPVPRKRIERVRKTQEQREETRRLKEEIKLQALQFNFRIPWQEPATALPDTDKEVTASWYCQCVRCGKQWTKRTPDRPRACPGCKQPKWDIPAWQNRNRLGEVE